LGQNQVTLRLVLSVKVWNKLILAFIYENISPVVGISGFLSA